MGKKVSVAILLGMSSLIMVSGVVFSIFCMMADVKFQVMRSQVPGVIFGLIAVYLGLRYFKAVLKLSRTIENPEMKFSWANFKRADKAAGK